MDAPLRSAGNTTAIPVSPTLFQYRDFLESFQFVVVAEAARCVIRADVILQYYGQGSRKGNDFLSWGSWPQRLFILPVPCVMHEG